MKNLKITIVIKNVDDWAIKWDDETDVKDAINSLNRDIIYCFDRNLGVDSSKLTVDTQIEQS